MKIVLEEKIYLIIKKIEVDVKKYGNVTFRDSPYLQEISDILSEQDEHDEKTLLFIYDCYLFLGQAYDDLGRFALSVRYREQALNIAVILKTEHNVHQNNISDVLYKLIKNKNYYLDDECLDTKKVAEMLLEKEEVEKIFASALASRRSLKHDPVEMSEEYLAVIDEVEEKIEKNKTLSGRGSYLEIWSLKREYLKEKGIDWKSPAMLNPRVRFD